MNAGSAASAFSNVLSAPEGTPTEAACGPAEWQARVDLALVYRLLDHFRMTDLIHTHVSARVPDTHDQFLQLPYGLLFSEAKASNMVKCAVDGTILVDPTGLGISVGGFRIHGAIHMARADAGVVLHAHTRATVAVSALRDGLLPLSQHAMRFHKRIRYLEYGGVFDDPVKQGTISDALGDGQVLMMRNHGPLVVGRNAAEAFVRMYYLERACEIQLAIQAAGGEMILPEEEHAIFMAEAFEDRSLQGSTLQWRALDRMMRAQDPSFAD